MSNSSSSASSSGIGVFGLLGILFVALKLTNVIDWSWWWVTLPFWGGIAIFVVIAVGILLVAAIGMLLDGRAKRRKRLSDAGPVEF